LFPALRLPGCPDAPVWVATPLHPPNIPAQFFLVNCGHSGMPRERSRPGPRALRPWRIRNSFAIRLFDRRQRPSFSLPVPAIGARHERPGALSMPGLVVLAGSGRHGREGGPLTRFGRLGRSVPQGGRPPFGRSNVAAFVRRASLASATGQRLPAVGPCSLSQTPA
jgi:hypothetical protein